MMLSRFCSTQSIAYSTVSGSHPETVSAATGSAAGAADRSGADEKSKQS